MSKLTGNQIKTLVTVGILALVMASATLVAAQGPGAGKGTGRGMRMGGGSDGEMGPGQRLDRLAARLELTEEQSKAIESIHQKNREKGTQLRKELMRLRNEAQGEMLKDNPSEKTVLSLNQKMGEIKTELKANRLKTRLAVREQLTPQQRDKMLMMGQRSRHSGEGFKGHHGRKSGGRNEGRRPGKGDGTGPRAGIDCPQNNK